MMSDDETQRELRTVMFVGGKASVGVGAWICGAKHGEVTIWVSADVRSCAARCGSCSWSAAGPGVHHTR